MKTCEYCGREIPDGEVCDCPDAAARRERDARRRARRAAQQAQQTQQTQQTKQESELPEAYHGIPIPDDTLSEKLMKSLHTAFQNPKQAVAELVKEKNLKLPLMYIAALFAVMLITCNCIYGVHAAKGILTPGSELSIGGGAVSYNFFLSLFAAILLTCGMAVLYVAARILTLMLCSTKKQPLADRVKVSLTSFAVNALVPMCLILLGGLFYLASSMVGWFFFVLAIIWLVVSGVTELWNALDSKHTPFMRLVLTAGIAGLAVALYLWLYIGMFAMNVHIVGDHTTQYNIMIQTLKAVGFSGY